MCGGGFTAGDIVEVTGDITDSFTLTKHGTHASPITIRGTPRTKAFIERRGHGDPVIEGSNNWISQKAVGIPETFVETIRGTNPKFADLLNFDFRPRRDSPLAGAGLWPLPKGRIVDLVPEFEPRRGIPADLKPKPRHKVAPPSIGPFQVAE